MAKKTFVALWCTIALALTMLVGCASPTNNGTLANGEYQAAVTLEGGSGRASITSPTRVTVEDGHMTATIEWSSPNYDYMIVDGERYLPVNTNGNSTFQIPVPTLGEPFEVVADTTAMSVPHEIEYQITLTLE